MDSLTSLFGGSKHSTACPVKNVGEVERYGSLFAGGLLLVNGVQRGKLSGLVLAGLGAGLIYRGYTGHCALYDQLGMNTRGIGASLGVRAQRGLRFERSVTVQRPAAELYALWRNFSNLPRFMRHLESVTETGGGRSRWLARGPMGMKVEWEAEVHNEDPGRLIAWRSLPGGQVEMAGSVHFEQRGSATEVRVALKYNPPGGRLGANIAWLMGDSVEQEVSADLQSFKKAMEQGAVVTNR